MALLPGAAPFKLLNLRETVQPRIMPGNSDVPVTLSMDSLTAVSSAVLLASRVVFITLQGAFLLCWERLSEGLHLQALALFSLPPPSMIILAHYLTEQHKCSSLLTESYCRLWTACFLSPTLSALVCSMQQLPTIGVRDRSSNGPATRQESRDALEDGAHPGPGQVRPGTWLNSIYLRLSVAVHAPADSACQTDPVSYCTVVCNGTSTCSPRPENTSARRRAVTSRRRRSSSSWRRIPTACSTLTG